MTQFSIVINTYNQEHLIRDAVDSALLQPCTSKEVIVVDDASTDGTANVLAEYGSRIRLIKLQKNHGANRARNIGAAAATGKFLVPLDGDDLFLPWALSTYERIIELKKAKIILCRLLFFNGAVPKPEFSDFGKNLQIVEYETLIKKDRSYRGSVSAIVIDRRIFNEAGGWTDEIWPSEIDDLQMKLAYAGRAVHILSHPTTAYRMHPHQTMNQLHRFLDTIHLVINKEKEGEYPGGVSCRYQRCSYIGGMVFFWFIAALKSAHYRRAVKLIANGWLPVLIGFVSQIKIKIKGKRPEETITVEFSGC